ncbi:carbohydrate-binding family 9-like protein [Haloarcula marina]|uniref:carbohydrate-binding family 9-like protein n=1 Tax=Haloarcula marina TaxID=2961574 RepID=UPI0020B6D40D|nr:carbohydrate-binding family 9-like protein [Halomicroarcula marina]
MRSYTVERTYDTVPLTGRVDGTPWCDASRLAVDQFNWHNSGPKPLTTARLLYDDEALYAQFQVEDEHITSVVTELNGPTFEDSSVELFADPRPNTDSNTSGDEGGGGDADQRSRYFNFEANCCGVFKLAWQEEDWQKRAIGRDLISPELADQIDVATSVDGPTREARPTDDGWWLAARIPFVALSGLTGVDINPESGTVWCGNVYRSGVERDAMKATWNPMPTPEPDYHSPEFFGRLRFA